MFAATAVKKVKGHRDLLAEAMLQNSFAKKNTYICLPHFSKNLTFLMIGFGLILWFNHFFYEKKKKNERKQNSLEAV